MGTQEVAVTKDIVAGHTSAVNGSSPKEIKVTIHIPDSVSENILQQKVNRIYDLLKPKNDA